MNAEDYKKLAKSVSGNANCLIINQVNNKKTEHKKEDNIEIINVNEKGLSKSRNLAISTAENDIICFADDDVQYNNKAVDIITSSYNKWGDHDIICFYVKSMNKARKTKRLIPGKMNKITSMRVVSYEITCRRKSLIDNNLKFDENYGANAKYNHGEEQIFLCDAIDKNMRIKTINKQIGIVNNKKSTWWNEEKDDNYFKEEAIIFKRMTKKHYKFLINQFLLRKFLLKKGIKECLRLKKLMYETTK